jgi:hypothetical protein
MGDFDCSAKGFRRIFTKIQFWHRHMCTTKEKIKLFSSSYFGRFLKASAFFMALVLFKSSEHLLLVLSLIPAYFYQVANYKAVYLRIYSLRFIIL